MSRNTKDTDKFLLYPTEVRDDSTWDDPLGENRMKPKARAGSSPGIKLYTCPADELARFMKALPGTSALYIVGLRDGMNLHAVSNQLKGAHHLPLTANQKEFDAWRKGSEESWRQLLQAAYVVVHCDVGQDRSPTFILNYAAMCRAAIANDSHRDPDVERYWNRGQKICLLHKGYFSGWMRDVAQQDRVPCGIFDLFSYMSTTNAI